MSLRIHVNRNGGDLRVHEEKEEERAVLKSRGYVRDAGKS